MPNDRQGRLSRLQQGMLLEQTRNPSLSVYNQAISIRVPRAIDGDALRGAWRIVTGRHDCMRTTFHWEAQYPVCRVHAALEPELRVRPVRGIGDRELLELARADAQQPFVLEEAPSRLTVFDLGPSESLLVVNCHHLISDAASFGTVLRELSLAYASLRGGVAPDLPPPAATTYEQFAEAEEAVLSGERGRALETFWREELVDAPRLQLPTDRPRSSSIDRSGCLRFVLGEDTTSALLRLSEGSTLFRTILGAYAAFLHRYTGQTDLGVHTPSSVRTKRFEHVVGPFVNDIVLRMALAPKARFTDWLEAAGEVAKRAGRHRELPFADIVRVAQPTRDPTRALLREASLLVSPEGLPTRVMCSLPVDLGELSGRGWPMPQQDGANDVDLRVFKGEGRLHCELHYRLDLFDPKTADRMVQHLCTMLESIARDPACRVCDLPLLAPQERRAIVALGQGPATEPPRADAACAHTWFEHAARTTPDAVAFVDQGRRFSYKEADAWANRLAAALRSAGVERESRVGLLAPRSIEAFVGILGILKAGGAYVPVDPTLPASRQRLLLERCRARIAVVVDEPTRLVPVELAVGRYREAAAGAEAPAVTASPDQAMVLIHTSGSTGEPKAVLLPHRGPVTYAATLLRGWDVVSGDKILQFASLSFDVSLEEMLLAWMSGATLVLRSDEMLHPAALLEACREHAITIVDLPAAYFAQVVDAVADAGGWPASVRLVIIGGERAPAGTIARFDAVPKRPRLFNMYGPAEASISVTWCDAAGRSSPAAADQLESLLGRPIDGRSVYVLDDQLSPVPPGVVGELCVGGADPLARGYDRAPALTARAFVPDPFAPGQRLYRTGDQARWTPDGTLQFVGRNDDQVKIRGFRIEPAEIEAVLARHPAIAESVVLAIDAPPAGVRLVAYVRLADPSFAGDLREVAAQQLPAYMVPSSFAVVPSWPTTAHGKIDRRALARLGVGSSSQREYSAPRSEFEATVARIWAEVLGVPRVGIHDNFFELGGHSLMALGLKRKLEDWLHVEVPIASLLQGANVEVLTRLLQRKVEAPDEFKPTALQMLTPSPGQRYEPFPLTDMQQAYWLGRSVHFDLGGIPAQAYVEFECSGLDIDRLGAAFQRVVDRHDMFRTVILSETEQRVLRDVPRYELKVDDLRETPAIVPERLLATRQQMCDTPRPDAGHWPLFDVRVTRLTDATFRLHLRVELVVADAWSATILFDEWSRFYASPGLALPPLELGFRDYVLGLRDFEAHPTYQRSKAYWWSRIPKLAPAPDLPLASGMTTLPGSRFVSRTAELDEATWQRVQALGARAGLTPSALVCAAFADVLATWSKSRSFTINCLFYNRMPNHPEVEKLVGNFSSTSLLSVDATPDDFESRARAIQAQLWEDLNHSHVSGVNVLRELNRVRGAGTRPTMPVVFASTLPLDKHRPRQSVEWPGKLVLRAMQTPQVLFDHQVSEENGRLVIVWDVVDAAFPPGMIDAMFDAYRGLLQTLADDPAAWTATRACLVPAADLAQRSRANATEQPVHPDLLHGLFVAQAAKTPGRVAVVCGQRRLTYDELLRLASAVAGRLRAGGAKPNQLVAVVMEKGWEQVVAAIGIMLAGAAYLPVDATLPAERMRALLAAGEVTLAVTQPASDAKIEWPPGIVRIEVGPSLLGSDDTSPGQGASAQATGDLAYVIFTSGSTGVPKGVMIDHRGAVNTVLDINAKFAVTADDRILAISSLSFDLSVYDIFAPLAVGGTVVVPTQEMIRDPAALVDLLAAEGVTIWNSVPALLGMVVDHCAERARRLPAALRLALLSGDWIPVPLPGRLNALSSGCRLVSLGGATEASIWSVWFPVDRVDPTWTSIPYGKPLANQRLHVLDEAMAPCPTWVAGNLYIGGIGLSLGYWRDEAKTNAAFRLHPRTGERLYRTGDLARYLPDGNVEFLGREDLQVKVQGYRIELGDVEAALGEHPSVQACACIAQGDRTNRRLVAFAVARAGRTVGAEELVTFLAAKLPAYMIPSRITLIDSMPLSSNGKVDRGALVGTQSAERTAAAQFVAPRTSLEMRVATIWREVLGTARLGVQDEFFAAGGTSLHAVRIASRIDQTFGKRLPVSSLLRGATIESVASALRDGAIPASSGRLVPLQPAGDAAPLFFVHPIGGSVFCYAALARALGQERPFHALQARGLEGDDQPHGSIEAMALEYLAEIRALRPHGPYRLGGWSMGGLVAFELAQLLVREGEQVELLALVDTGFPEAQPAAASAEESAFLLARDLEGLSGRTLAVQREELAGLSAEDQQRLVVDRARATGTLPADLPAKDLARLVRVFAANAQAIRAYRPTTYPGRATLLVAAAGTTRDEGWRDIVTGGVELRLIPGDHYAVVRSPAVEVLALELARTVP